MGSFGESLKRERELRDISLREIADATKISVRYLEALEQNRFGVLPGGVFNKGFIRAVAAFIGADADALVDSYMLEIAAREQPPAGVAEIGRPASEGLHRPVEAPRRRAGAVEMGAPVSGSGNGHQPQPAPVQALPQPRAPDLSLEKLAAALETRRAMERAALGRGRPRLLPVAGSFLGGAAIVFALLFVARAVTRSHAPLGRASEATAGLARPPEAAKGTDPAASDPSSTAEPENPQQTAQPQIAAPQDAQPLPSVAMPPPPAIAAPPPAQEARRETAAERPKSPAPAPSPPIVEKVEPKQTETSAARSTALSSMDLRLEATSPVLVQVSCDGEDRLNRPLLPGEVATMRCFSLIRVSATDAGALRLVVNGRRCAALGEAGSRVQGFAIRNDDVDAICPAWGGASDAGR